LFRDFVLLTTEVVTRIKIGETGTVARGALFAEENLPADTLLYTLALATDLRGSGTILDDKKDAEAVLKFFQDLVNKCKWVQFGGDETVGRGIVRAVNL
jgi:Uncharacterized protein predicted to be involved in DNA repair (RAMP superfamily)